MQGFVSGIGHHESKRLYDKFASSPKFMCLAEWFNAVFNDNFPKFCEWNKGWLQKRCLRNLFRIYLLMLKAMKSVFLCIFLNENYCVKAKLMETKFIYRVIHACTEFKLKISDRKKYFPCFFDNPNWSVKPSWLRPPQTMETPKKGFNFLNFNLKRNRSRRKTFAVEKTDKVLYDDQLLVLFFLANFYVEWKDIRVIDISASERQNCLLHLLSLEFWVLSFPHRAAIDQDPWFTGTIEHRFSNSLD